MTEENTWGKCVYHHGGWLEGACYRSFEDMEISAVSLQHQEDDLGPLRCATPDITSLFTAWRLQIIGTGGVEALGESESIVGVGEGGVVNRLRVQIVPLCSCTIADMGV